MQRRLEGFGDCPIISKNRTRLSSFGPQIISIVYGACSSVPLPTQRRFTTAAKLASEPYIRRMSFVSFLWSSRDVHLARLRLKDFTFDAKVVHSSKQRYA
mmetsp:Transcript_18934/g.15844  ORF Transcript_18934/g.15844 Transcript_18934/m.15844 type:complete len:100 (+) Transcript_18934:107-406(+)